MDISATAFVGILDRIGIVAFAFSGVEVGHRRRFDLFGLLVMGLVTSTGGGAMRDLLILRIPFVLRREDYILWAAGATIAAIALVWTRHSIPRPLLHVADAAGLGAFAVAGALAGIEAELPVVAVMLLAVATATGGGVIRDLLADRIPIVLRTEVNATAAALGGLTTWLVQPASIGLAVLLGAGTAALVRVAGIAFDLHLPVPGGRPEPASRAESPPPAVPRGRR